MTDEDFEATLTYHVVVNDEEQYSIWADGRDVPPGWHTVGVSGPKAECLAHIERVWTDMRPLSLRRRMEELERNPPPEETEIPDHLKDGPTLVERLSDGDHPVEVSIRPETTLAALRAKLQDGYVHLKFTDTRGGTELGIAIERSLTVAPDEALEAGAGTIHVVGDVTLDYVPCRAVFDIDLASLRGRGHLEPLRRED
jgi:uncharacterized protein YbdZ (MbtH family)